MIVVTAPTGQIGRRLLDKLLESDEPLRVIARDSSRLSTAVREGAEVFEGSHGDADVLSAAFAGADTVFWLIPPNPQVENIDEYYLGFTEPACAAIARASVERVVAISSLGRGFDANAGVLTSAFLMEERLEKTGVDLRTLRMPFFMENLLNQVEAIRGQGMFFMANQANRPLATVATPDIATAAAELLLDGSWSGQGSVQVVGPDNLSPREMATVISSVLERPVRCQEVPLEAYKQTILDHGASPAFAQGLVDMVRAQNDGVYDAEARTSPPLGITRFEDWCRGILAPAVLA